MLFLGIGVRASADSVDLSVSSGGVSLGSYQGGYLLGKALQDKDSTAERRRILTGASAGAINTLGGLYYAFHRPGAYDPYSEWLKIDWSRIANDESSLEEGHLFSTGFIEERLDTLLANLLEEPAPSLRGREVRAGFAITRFLPPKVGKNVQARQTSDKIVVGLRWLAKCPDAFHAGAGCYQAWSEVFSEQNDSMEQPVLWFGPYGTNDTLIRSNLKNLALASGAFPVAFAPRKLPLFKLGNSSASDWNAQWGKNNASPPGCFAEAVPLPGVRRPGLQEGTVGVRCPSVRGKPLDLPLWRDSAWGRWDGDTAKYSDGGMFENQPLEMAFRIRQNSMPPDDIASIGMLIPDRYPYDFGRESRISRGMVSEWILFLTTRWPGQTETELERALRRKESGADKFTVNQVSLPLASEHFFAFSGFFDERFRRFDFLVGFLDAHFREGGLDTAGLRASLERMRVGGSVPLLRVLDGPLGKFMVRLVAARVFLWPTDKDSAASKATKARIAAVGRRLDTLQSLCPTLTGDERKLAQVVRASLFVQASSLENWSEGSPSDAADRYRSFRRGLKSSNGFHADALYARVAGLFDRDAYGMGNAFTYPFLLYHLREGMAFGFGSKPLWSAPYLRLEGASSGVRLWQGFSMVPRHLVGDDHPYLNRVFLPLRLELGGRFILNEWPPKAFAGVRVGYESPFRSWTGIPGLSWISIVPNYTYESALGTRSDAWGPGVDVRLADLVNFSFEQEHREGTARFVATAGVQIGFDLFAIAEGMRNGTNRERGMR